MPNYFGSLLLDPSKTSADYDAARNARDTFRLTALAAWEQDKALYRPKGADSFELESAPDRGFDAGGHTLLPILRDIYDEFLLYDAKIKFYDFIDYLVLAIYEELWQEQLTLTLRVVTIKPGAYDRRIVYIRLPKDTVKRRTLEDSLHELWRSADYSPPS